MAATELGRFLRERRERLDALALGCAVGRRRTTGLRREEVAQRANISTTWYAWLEQGRGGKPSGDILDRLARALMLTDSEREHLFLLGLGRLPDTRYRPSDGVTARLQRVLDALVSSPALIVSPLWDVVAWNAAAAAVLTNYAELPTAERNVLRLVFLDPRSRARNVDWEDVAEFVVAVFRSSIARAGASAIVKPLVDDLRRLSPDFTRLWEHGDVHGPGEGTKHLRHPVLGDIALEFSAFAVDGRPDLTMLVFTPASSHVAGLIAAMPGERLRG